MPLHYERLYEQLQYALAACLQSPGVEKHRLEQCYQHSYTTWMVLRKAVRHHKTFSLQEEILLYKTIIPLFLTPIKYYSLRYQALLFAPPGLGLAGRFFWQQELFSIKTFLRSHASLYRYYKERNTHLDRYLFTRQANDIEGMPYPILFNRPLRGWKDCSDGFASLAALEQYEAYVKDQAIT